MSYCNSLEKVVVSYAINNQNKQITILNGPVDVSIAQVVDPTSSVSCFRFSGQGLHNDSYYDFFACGRKASYVDTGEFLRPYVDGNYPFQGEFGVRYGTASLSQVSTDATQENYIKVGDCVSCGITCQIQIKSNGKLVHAESGSCPITFTVACGEECPDGYCKIDCPEYPGYCCINLAEIEALSLKIK